MCSKKTREVFVVVAVAFFLERAWKHVTFAFGGTGPEEFRLECVSEMGRIRSPFLEHRTNRCTFAFGG